MKTQIEDGKTIFCQRTKAEAADEALKLVSDDVEIIGVALTSGLGETKEPVAYFVVPKNEKCPCCGRMVT